MEEDNINFKEDISGKAIDIIKKEYTNIKNVEIEDEFCEGKELETYPEEKKNKNFNDKVKEIAT